MNRRAGFTLLELLVVIGIIGVLSTIGVTMFHKMTSAWRQQSVRVEMNERADGAFDRLGKDLAEVIPSALCGTSVRGEAREYEVPDNPLFAQKPLADDLIDIPALLPDIEGERQLSQHVVYWLDRGEDGSGELVRTQSLLGEGVPEDKAVSYARGVIRMRIEYADGAEWVTGWHGPDHPDAVRISLALRDADTGEEVARKAVFPINVD